VGDAGEKREGRRGGEPAMHWDQTTSPARGRNRQW